MGVFSAKMVECLESRTMLSASAPVTLSNPPVSSPPLPAQIIHKVLTIEGTRAAEVISIRVGDDSSIIVDVGAQEFTFSSSSYKSILINAGRGDDLVSIGSVRRPIFAPALVWGGLGNDTISSGAGNDELHGGSGWDSIFGGAGNDIVVGESQSDTLFGGDGDDTLLGGESDDIIVGNAGADIQYGNAGSDLFVIEPGESRRRQVSDPGNGDTSIVNDGTYNA